MEKEFIPFKLAFSLLCLGFTESCLNNYSTAYHPTLNPGYLLGIKPTTPVMESQSHKLGRWYIGAPLYQQAFGFFRDKYKLFCTVHNDYKTKAELNPYFYMIDDCPSIGYKVYSTQKDVENQKHLFYPDYETAQIEALKKLILLCENI